MRNKGFQGTFYSQFVSMYVELVSMYVEPAPCLREWALLRSTLESIMTVEWTLPGTTAPFLFCLRYDKMHHFEPEWVCPPSTNYFLMVVVQCTPHASRSIIFTNPLLTCLFSSYCVVFSSSHWDVQPTAVHTSGERRAGGMDEGHGKMIRTLKWMENRNACVTELEFVQIKSTCDKLSLSFRVFWGRWAVERL